MIQNYISKFNILPPCNSTPSATRSRPGLKAFKEFKPAGLECL